MKKWLCVWVSVSVTHQANQLFQNIVTLRQQCKTQLRTWQKQETCIVASKTFYRIFFTNLRKNQQRVSRRRLATAATKPTEADVVLPCLWISVNNVTVPGFFFTNPIAFFKVALYITNWYLSVSTPVKSNWLTYIYGLCVTLVCYSRSRIGWDSCSVPQLLSNYLLCGCRLTPYRPLHIYGSLLLFYVVYLLYAASDRLVFHVALFLVNILWCAIAIKCRKWK